MEPERSSKSSPSIVPITERKPAVRLPAEQLDRLLQAVCEFSPGQNAENAVATVLDCAASFYPAASFGVRIPHFRPSTSDHTLVVRRTKHLVCAQPEVSGPLFPELSCESQYPIDMEPEGVLVVAANEASVLPEGAAGDALISRLTMAVGAALRMSRQLARAPASIPPSDDQRRHAVNHDKLAGLGKIVAGVVHELNNPVTSILAYADFLRRKLERGPLDRADFERIERIEEAARRIHGFSRELIAYARPSVDIAVPLTIHDVIDRALVFCEHVLSPQRVTVERAFGEVRPVQGIGNQLAQVFVNLFTNAANAMGPEGGTLSIETSLDEDESHVHVAVHDTGTGIGEHALSKIFEPFFTTSESGDGTGLGLSIVRDIVEAHRGRVWAERREGAGATFHVVLPVLMDDD